MALRPAIVVWLVLTTPACATDWRMLPAKSWLGFAGTMAGAPFDGRFTHWEAAISFDAADPGHGHAVVMIDMASAVTGDLQKDRALPQSDWFDAKTFPNATFEALSFRLQNGNSYEAAGTLTIRNVKKDVTMPVTIEITGDSLRAKGHLNLVRTDYGVGQGAWASAQWVALDVMAAFEVIAARE